MFLGMDMFHTSGGRQISPYVTVGICMLFFAVCASDLSAQTSSDTLDVNGRKYFLSGAVPEMGEGLYNASPSANLYRQELSFTEIGVSYFMRDESGALILQEGDRFDNGNFGADSYIRLNDHSVAFASVGYVNGKKRNVLWNSSSDFLLLYPYVTADTVGGDLSHEKYAFSGGYSRRDGRFGYGAMASYRALHEYRKTDPRPRNITSDFNAVLSLGYEAGANLLYAAFSGRIYRQISDVRFYDPAGANTVEMPMTGLGTYFERFTGNGVFLGTYHKGNGYSVRIGTIPCNTPGWIGEAVFSSFTVDRLLSNQNDVPITSLNQTDFSVYAGYKGNSWGVSLCGSHKRRSGTEMIIDNGASDIYNVLGASVMYMDEKTSVSLSLCADWRRGGVMWSFAPVAGWTYSTTEYLYPERQMGYSGIHARIPVKAVLGAGAWLFVFRLGLSASVNIGRNLHISPEGEDAAVSDMVEYMFANLSSSFCGGDCSVRIQRALNRTMAVFAEGRGGYAFFDSGVNACVAEVKVGICF